MATIVLQNDDKASLKWLRFCEFSSTTVVQPKRPLSAESSKMLVSKALYYQVVSEDMVFRNVFNDWYE
jgi:hypothetical protein